MTEASEILREAGPDDAGERGQVDVFISYRVRPDEELAGELRTLLESAIEPKPNVFVSGLGGLRATADSYREQLRKAAAGARAYVGLITKASIDREWIFFEAGAAFGRGVLYAPILVDAEPTDLPSSIGGYQGANAKDQPRMKDLVQDVAVALGGKMKPHFGQRFARFSKAVEVYGKPIKEELSGIRLAIELVETGRREEAEKLFAELESAAETAEAKANIRIAKLFYTRRENAGEFIELLEQEPVELQETVTFKFWRGYRETNPVRAVQFLREAYDGGLDGFLRRLALESLVRNEFQLGHNKAATSRLLAALIDSDRQVRPVAATQLALHVGDGAPLLKAILLVEATVQPSFDYIMAALTHCWEQNYTAVGLHLAHRCVAKESNEHSHLRRGLLRGQADLRSLSFEDYRKAAQLGASVAKSNMARILSSGPVAEAGLEILREHSGGFNSADPGSPYQIRAALERSVHEERQRENALCSYGGRVTKAIHRLFEGWRRSQANARREGRWFARSKIGSWELRSERAQFSVTLDGQALAVLELAPLNGFYACLQGNVIRLLVVFGGELEAVAVHGFAEDAAIDWLELELFDDEPFAVEKALSVPEVQDIVESPPLLDVPVDENN